MTSASNGQASMIRTERGLTIAGTRITLKGQKLLSLSLKSNRAYSWLGLPNQDLGFVFW
jgi:hypothetical protein